MDDYAWFGAEVVSPVLPLGEEQARQAIRDACGSLRNSLRCHKPMQVSTGLHIHLGHTQGWTLFQAKRFASFWFLAEKTLLSLHRIDRDQDKKVSESFGSLTLSCSQAHLTNSVLQVVCKNRWWFPHDTDSATSPQNVVIARERRHSLVRQIKRGFSGPNSRKTCRTGRI
ncbi:hypothetical protein F4859DRAFT_463289 [Xylaria cf. heliscus]|nr:hypothetical protein F4859DRAFT_463289 [Xylaria cf. heliscus]